MKAWQMGRSDPLLTYVGHKLVVTAIDVNEGEIEIQLKCWLEEERKSFLAKTSDSDAQNLPSVSIYVAG